MDTRHGQLAVIIPAYNEEASIGPLLAELRAVAPGALALVVSDGSDRKSTRLNSSHR